MFIAFSLSASYLYQIAHLGDDDEEPEFSSAMPLEEGDTFFFQPRPLKNLVLVDEQENLSPIMSCQVCVWEALCVVCLVCMQRFYLLIPMDCTVDELSENTFPSVPLNWIVTALAGVDVFSHYL